MPNTSNWTPVSACCFDSSVRLQRRSEGAGYSDGIVGAWRSGGFDQSACAMDHRPCPGTLRTLWHSDPIRASRSAAQLTCQRNGRQLRLVGQVFIRGLLVDPAFSREADRSSSICGRRRLRCTLMVAVEFALCRSQRPMTPTVFGCGVSGNNPSQANHKITE